ncbi:tetratricopeptide repeat protein [Pseudoalteromonas umbrosa]|uniref:tetratricopeptide repeat protein n=1 Tax=Pseudoalteromonas umbrosa TaxID=3048489 RepID=UPI0024C24D1E|nr:tetratricopeptide repeat protein [Pseudoalteromonas sp. B95]MDK1286099.1 tetratricopeptide repeat protein [Pseudoalteromonas sp. B95]
MNRTFTFFLLTACLAFSDSTIAKSYKLELEPVKFVIPAYSEQYSEREVTLRPEEYELAEKLSALLDRKDFTQVSKELETFYNVELSPALLMIKAQVYFSLKQYEKAQKLYQFILKTKPQLVRAHEDLGQLSLIQENFELARSHFAKAISLGSDNAMVHGQLGYLNLHQHGAFSALYAYQKAYSLEPNNAQWQQGLVTSLVKAKMYPSALAMLEELITKDPKTQSYWLTKAAIQLDQKHNEQALKTLEYATLLGPISHQNTLLMINLHFEQSQYDRAIELLKGVAQQGKLKFADINNYLYWLNNANRWQDSEWLINHFDDSESLNNTEKSTLFYSQARILEAKKQHKKAIDLYKNALGLNANNANALLSFAQLLLQQKRFISAEQMFIRAEAFDSHRLQAMLGRTQLYINTDDLQSAYNLLLDAKNKFPETPGIQNKIEVLANIVNTQSTNTL